MKYDKSFVMARAWMMYRDADFEGFEECLRRSWKLEKDRFGIPEACKRMAAAKARLSGNHA